MRAVGVIGLLALILAGCVIAPVDVPVKIYDVENGDAFTAVFKWTGRQGSVSATMNGGAQCSGQYLTQASGSSGNSSTWGSIYGLGSTASASSKTNYTATENSEQGTVIMTCSDKNVLQCEYIVNRDNHGSGFCRDNKSKKYRFIY